MTSGVHSSLRVPADLAVVSFVRSALACMLTRGEWPAGGSARVLLASTEALTNAIEHGSPPGRDGAGGPRRSPPSAPTCWWWTRAVRTGRCHGCPTHPPPPTATRGRGLIIISRLADDFDLRAHGDGTEVSVGFVRAAGYEDGRLARRRCPPRAAAERLPGATQRRLCGPSYGSPRRAGFTRSIPTTHQGGCR